MVMYDLSAQEIEENLSVFNEEAIESLPTYERFEKEMSRFKTKKISTSSCQINQ